MKKLSLVLIAIAVLTTTQAQTLYVPSGTLGIGSSPNSNVGIGTTTPQEKLHVEGNVYIGNNQMQFLSTAGGNNRIQSVYGNVNSVTGSWNFKSRFDNIVLDAGENAGNERKIIFRTAGTDRMMVDNFGNVGIGTTSPSQKLHVEGNFYLNAGSFLINQTPTTDAKIYFHNQGNSAWDLGMETSNPSNNFILYNGTNSTYPLSFSTTNIPTFTTDKIRLQGMANGGGTVNVWDIRCRDIIDNDFGIYNVAQATYRLYVNNLGNVGIGTTAPGSFKLAVEGKIGAREINVLAGPGWPDYVFEKNYKLRSLEEIKTYIDQNKHLPDVPPAKEMEKNGVQLGEMNMLLLKKIEELTLYVIDLKKESQEQKAKSEAQQNEIEVLKSKIQ